MKFTFSLAALLLMNAAFARADAPLTDDNAALQYWQGTSMITDGTRKILDDFDHVEFEGDVLNEVRDNNARMQFLYAGAAMPRCDWGLDYRQGYDLLMPHLGMCRDLGRLALLRARYRFEQGRFHDGVQDVLATFELAKDLGSTPIMISQLVQYSIDQMAIDTLARSLPRMDRATLDELAKALEAIPAPDPFSRVFPQQLKYFADKTLQQVDKIDKESGGDMAKWRQGVLAMTVFANEDNGPIRRNVPPPAELREMIESIKKLLVEEERIAGLPIAEQDQWLDKIEKQANLNPLQQVFVPAQRKIFQTRRRWQARHAMLDAAVAVVRDGEKALQVKRYADPFGDGPFTYRKTDGGFELQSKLLFEGKAVSVSVGATALPNKL
jgi:hypothetical protein